MADEGKKKRQASSAIPSIWKGKKREGILVLKKKVLAAPFGWKGSEDSSPPLIKKKRRGEEKKFPTLDKLRYKN